MLETYLKQLSSQYSLLVNFEKDVEGFMHLQIDPHLDLFLKELPKGMMCKATVAPMPGKDQEDLLALLMRANYLGQGTKGGVLALDDTAQTIIFFSSISYEYTYPEFKDKIEEVMNYLNYWKTRIKDETSKR
jgi:hypothetical protein